MARIFGVDVAFGNPLTPARVAKLDFAIPRIGTLGYGGINTTSYFSKTLSVDSAFRTNIANMQAAGKPVGCYIFSYAWSIESARYEADRVCNFLDDNNIKLSMPIFFDWERTGEGTYGSYEMVTAAGVTVTAQLVRDITTAFMERCNARGYRAGWYQSAGDLASWWTTGIVNVQRYQYGRYLWVAQWASSSWWDNPNNADIWQYQGDVGWEGIDVDKNYIINERVLTDTGFNKKQFLLLYLANKRRKQQAVFKRKRC